MPAPPVASFCREYWVKARPLTLFLQLADTDGVSRRGLALLLLACAALLAFVGPALEGRQRGPEAAALAYLRAVEAGDLDGALEQIAPDRRAALRERVALQIRNRYGVLTLVQGQPSLLDRWSGRAGDQAWVTVLADVTAVSGERWRSTSTAPLEQRDGRWYLTRPLFA